MNQLFSTCYSTLQFISVPLLFHLYRKYFNINIFFAVLEKKSCYKTKKLLSKQDYIDIYKNKLENLYKIYRSQCLNNYDSPDSHVSYDSPDSYDTFKHLDNCFIIEYTPKGNVIMKYDSDNNTINYYCDNSISNDIIRTVFQKFTITYHCFDLYFGIIEKKHKSHNNHNNHNDNDNSIKKRLISKIVEGKNTNVFAKLKKKSNFNQVNTNDFDKNNHSNNDIKKKDTGKDIYSNNISSFCTIRNSGKFYDAKIFNSQNIIDQDNNNGNKNDGKTLSFSEFKNTYDIKLIK